MGEMPVLTKQRVDCYVWSMNVSWWGWSGRWDYELIIVDSGGWMHEGLLHSPLNFLKF